MTARESPLCDCDEPCGCYAEGYAAGKDKAYFEMLASLDGPPHAQDLRLPALPGQTGLPAEGDDPDGQKFARDLRAGGDLGPGGPRQPALKWRPFPGKAPAQGDPGPGRRQEAPDREIPRTECFSPRLKHPF